jgi:fructosamine-3-kinase
VQPLLVERINPDVKLTFSKSHVLFCKINNAATFPHLFLKEKQGLEALRKSGTVKTPGIIAYTTLQSYQVLLLEWIDSGAKTPVFFESLENNWRRCTNQLSKPSAGNTTTIWAACPS